MRKSNGKIKSCSIHDLVRDLCIKKAQEEKFLLLDRYVLQESIKTQRRISIVQSDLSCLANLYGSTIRTILCFQHRGRSEGYLGYFRFLRVLDVVNANWFNTELYVSLPDQIFELFLLRYCAFDYSIKISAAISNLKNLQTLIINPRKGWMYPLRLPLEIWRMPQLRHLVCYSFGPLPDPEEATFALENLQTLSAVKNLICTESILKMIPNLKKLGISYDQDDQDFHLDNLVYLHQLEKLKLVIYDSNNFLRQSNPAFPRTLKKLTLSGWRFPWKDMTIVGSLPNLQVLKLRDFACQGDKWETTEGEFPQLKFLLISGSDLEDWTTECSHFPSLKCLMLHYCKDLSEIPDGIGEIPTLELIEVKSGKQSLADSAKRIQEEQEDLGNDGLQVRCMPY